MKAASGVWMFAAGFAALAGAAEVPAPEIVQGLYEGTWKDTAGSAATEVRCVAEGQHRYKLLARRVVGDAAQGAEMDGTLDKSTGVVTFLGKIGEAETRAVYVAGTIKGTIGDRGTLELKRVVRTSPTLGRKPPKGAVVLLDGKDFSQMERSDKLPWHLGKMSEDGRPVAELLPPENGQPPASAKSKRRETVIGVDEDGSIRIPTGGMYSVRAFAGSFDAHVEFQCNFAPYASGQGRANSGVYLPNGQEIQVLDSFGMATYTHSLCGGLNGMKPPDGMAAIPSLAGKKDKEGREVYSLYALASSPPLQWQTYDIEYRVKANEKDQLAGCVTVHHNGVKIHDNVPLRHAPGQFSFRFHFQDHGNPVRFRNIWVLERADHSSR